MLTTKTAVKMIMLIVSIIKAIPNNFIPKTNTNQRNQDRNNRKH